MKYLLKVTEEYRVSTEEEATQLIEEAKKESGYILQKYGSQYKERKQKGEVIDSYFKVTLVKIFTDEKEPNFQTKITYETESAF
jgi:hypothetical protein